NLLPVASAAESVRHSDCRTLGPCHDRTDSHFRRSIDQGTTGKTEKVLDTFFLQDAHNRVNRFHRLISLGLAFRKHVHVVSARGQLNHCVRLPSSRTTVSHTHMLMNAAVSPRPV